MSGTVDTRTVEMRFDNSNFETNVKESMSTLNKLKAALKLDGASAGLKEVEETSKKLDFRDLNRSVENVGKKFSVLETIATGALLRIGASAAEAGMKMTKSLTIDQVASGWNKYAEKTEAVQTIMANIRDEEGQFVDQASKLEYVNRYLNKLLWFSDETSYSFTDMTSNVGKFIANGQGLQDSVTAMQGIATWAAISGQNSQVASRAMYNISQALGAGSMKIKDWMSIENANMATAQFKELAIAIGQKKGKIEEGQVTIENFRESLSGSGTNGWFDKDVMMEVFETYGEAANRIQEYAESHKVTSTEAIREIKKTDKEFADSLGFKAFAAAQEAKTFAEVVSATADAVSTKWMRIFENIFGDYLQAKELWTDLSEDLWNIFAGPLDTIGEIMDIWNKGFFKNGPIKALQRWYSSGLLDDINNGLTYTSKAAAEAAVAGDKAHYAIETLADGTKQLVKLVEVSPGLYQRMTKKIYDADKELLSGRDLLIGGFRNILRTFIFDWEDAEGNVHLSLFSTIKDGLKEVIFGTSDMEEIVPRVSKKLWDMTKRFHDFTEKLMPTEETLGKVKNAFKGVFSLFGIGGNFIKAIAKPFGDLIKNVFKNAPSTILDLADSIGTWVQKLGKWLDKNKIFTKLSSKVSGWIDKIKKKTDGFIKSLTGLSAKDYFKNLKNNVFGFFENYDFEGIYNTVTGFFSGISTQIKQVISGDLPEKLTPLQKFLNGIKKAFLGVKGFFSGGIVPIFKAIGSGIKSAFTAIIEGFNTEEAGDKVSRFKPIWDGFMYMFAGIGDFFEKIGPTLSKVGEGIGNFFRNLGDAINSWSKNKTPDEVLNTLIKGGFLINIARFVQSIVGLFTGIGRINNALVGDLKAVKKVLNAYAREINASTVLTLSLAIGALAGAMWILSRIPAGDLHRVGKALVQLAVLVAAAMYIFSKIKGAGKSEVAEVTKPLDAIKDILTATVSASIFANDWTAKLVKIGLAILLAAIAANQIVKAVSKMGEVLVQLADFPPEKIKRGGRIAGQIILAFGAFSLLSSFGATASSALFAAVGAYVLVLAIKKLIDVLADLGSDDAKMENIQKVSEKFSGVFDAVSTIAKWAVAIAAVLGVMQIVLTAFASRKGVDTRGVAKILKQFGKNFLRVALSLLIVSAAFAVMSYVANNTKTGDFRVIANFLIGFAAIIGVFQVAIVGIVAYAETIGVDTVAVLKQFGKNFLRIAASLLIVAAAFAILSALKFPNTSFGKIAAVFGVFLAVAGVLSGIALLASDATKSEAFVKNVKSISRMFLAAAASMLLMSGAIWIIVLAIEHLASIPQTGDKIAKVGDTIAAVVKAIGWTIGLLGVAAGLKFGVEGGVDKALSGNIGYNGKLGVPIAALSFLVACVGIGLMAQALSHLASVAVSGDEVSKVGSTIASLTTVVGGQISLLGALSGLSFSAKTGTGLDINYNGKLGVPIGAISFVIACVGIGLMAQALSHLASNGISAGAVERVGSTIQAITETIGWMLGGLGIVSGMNVFGTAGMFSIAYIGEAGMLLAAAGFVAACWGIKMMADALAELASDSISSSNVEKVGETIRAISKTIGWILGLLTGAAGANIAGIAGPVAFAYIGELGMAFAASGFVAACEGIKTMAEGIAKLASVRATEAQLTSITTTISVITAVMGLVLGVLAGLSGTNAVGIAGPVAFAFVGELGMKFAAIGFKTACEGVKELAAAVADLATVQATAGQLFSIAGTISIISIVMGLVLGLLTAEGSLNVLGLFVGSTGLKYASLSFNTACGGVRSIAESVKMLAEVPVTKEQLASITETIGAISGITGLILGLLTGEAGLEAGVDLMGLAKLSYSGETGISVAAASMTAISESIKNISDSVVNLASVTDLAAVDKATGTITGIIAKIKDIYDVSLWEHFTSDSIVSVADAFYNTSAGIGLLADALALISSINVDGIDEKIDSVNKVVDKVNSLLKTGKVKDKKYAESFKTTAEGISGIIDAISNLSLDEFSFDENFGTQLADGVRSLVEGTEGLDLSAFTGILTGSMENVDLVTIWKKKAIELKNAMDESAEVDISPAAEKIKEVIERHLSGVDSSTWGADAAKGFAAGLRSGADDIQAAAEYLASIVKSILGFSEPEKGPLSNFHTYAPDMIKLWCSGIHSNLGMVKDSTVEVADNIYDGFSTALDYVSNLIDNGMSDQLTIRPVLDLSEIQNGMGLMNGMLSTADGYTITGSTRLAASAAYGMGLKSFVTSSDPNSNTIENGTTNNTFYITNNDPNTVAEKVSKILGNQTKRQKAVWAYK